MQQQSHSITSVSAVPANRRTDNFDAIRLIAAVIVVYGHAFPLSGAMSIAVMGSSVQALAVKVFFILSGYLISESWRRDPDVVRYLTRRSLRIFPALIVVVLLSALVIGPLASRLTLSDYFSSPHILTYIRNILLEPSYHLPGVFEENIYPNAVNGSLWSLPVEFAMYLVIPCIMLFTRWQRLRVVVATFAFCGLATYFVRINLSASHVVFYGTSLVSALDVAPYFMLGAAWRLCATPKVFSIQAAFLGLILLCLVPAQPIVLEIALYIVLPYVVISFSLAQPATFAWMGRWGDFSYGVYLYGFVIQQMISASVKTTMSPFVNFVLALPITLSNVNYLGRCASINLAG